jgi:predicted DNA-binding transcriptional regulator AlpA
MEEPMDDTQLLNARELSKRLQGIGVSSIYRMAAKGLIPSISVGPKLGGRRFMEREVRDALTRLVQPPRQHHPRKSIVKQESVAP